MIRTIIIAAGEGTRWGNYTGVPKHQAVLNGERIIDRSCRLISKYTDDITVVANEDSYTNKYSKLYKPDLNQCFGEVDKFLSSRCLWSEDSRTIIFYGDVYFTEKAIEKIILNKKDDWTMFCRYGPSKTTGTEWGECFAVSFYPQHIKEADEKLNYIRSINIWRRGGWEWLRAMNGADLLLDRHMNRSVVIDDWTDDIDFPEDYDRMVKRMQECKDRGESID